MNSPPFWDRLAPYHSRLEDNFFDLKSVRQIAPGLREPVLVVGAGHGLLVAELRKKGLRCDGVDFSAEMLRQAKSRRGLELLQADARALPFADGTYATLIYATGVIDFTGDETTIESMLHEGLRVLHPSGKILIGFYRFSVALEEFLIRVGLLQDHVLTYRECFRMYLLSPGQMVAWVADRAGTGWLGATAVLLRLSILGALREKAMTFRMQKIFHNMEDPNALIQSAPETQPYRNKTEIVKLFERLSVPLKEIQTFPSCWIVEIERTRSRTLSHGPTKS